MTFQNQLARVNDAARSEMKVKLFRDANRRKATELVDTLVALCPVKAFLPI